MWSIKIDLTKMMSDNADVVKHFLNEHKLKYTFTLSKTGVTVLKVKHTDSSNFDKAMEIFVDTANFFKDFEKNLDSLRSDLKVKEELETAQIMNSQIKESELHSFVSNFFEKINCKAVGRKYPAGYFADLFTMIIERKAYKLNEYVECIKENHIKYGIEIVSEDILINHITMTLYKIYKYSSIHKLREVIEEEYNRRNTKETENEDIIDTLKDQIKEEMDTKDNMHILYNQTYDVKELYDFIYNFIRSRYSVNRRRKYSIEYFADLFTLIIMKKYSIAKQYRECIEEVNQKYSISFNEDYPLNQHLNMLIRSNFNVTSITKMIVFILDEYKKYSETKENAQEIIVKTNEEEIIEKAMRQADIYAKQLKLFKTDDMSLDLFGFILSYFKKAAGDKEDSVYTSKYFADLFTLLLNSYNEESEFIENVICDVNIKHNIDIDETDELFIKVVDSLNEYYGMSSFCKCKDLDTLRRMKGIINTQYIIYMDVVKKYKEVNQEKNQACEVIEAFEITEEKECNEEKDNSDSNEIVETQIQSDEKSEETDMVGTRKLKLRNYIYKIFKKNSRKYYDSNFSLESLVSLFEILCTMEEKDEISLTRATIKFVREKALVNSFKSDAEIVTSVKVITSKMLGIPQLRLMVEYLNDAYADYTNMKKEKTTVKKVMNDLKKEAFDETNDEFKEKDDTSEKSNVVLTKLQQQAIYENSLRLFRIMQENLSFHDFVLNVLENNDGAYFLPYNSHIYSNEFIADLITLCAKEKVSCAKQVYDCIKTVNEKYNVQFDKVEDAYKILTRTLNTFVCVRTYVSAVDFFNNIYEEYLNKPERFVTGEISRKRRLKNKTTNLRINELVSIYKKKDIVFKRGLMFYDYITAHLKASDKINNNNIFTDKFIADLIYYLFDKNCEDEIALRIAVLKTAEKNARHIENVGKALTTIKNVLYEQVSTSSAFVAKEALYRAYDMYCIPEIYNSFTKEEYDKKEKERREQEHKNEEVVMSKRRHDIIEHKLCRAVAFHRKQSASSQMESVLMGINSEKSFADFSAFYRVFDKIYNNNTAYSFEQFANMIFTTVSMAEPFDVNLLTNIMVYLRESVEKESIKLDDLPSMKSEKFFELFTGKFKDYNVVEEISKYIAGYRKLLYRVKLGIKKTFFMLCADYEKYVTSFKHFQRIVEKSSSQSKNVNQVQNTKLIKKTNKSSNVISMADLSTSEVYLEIIKALRDDEVVMDILNSGLDKNSMTKKLVKELCTPKKKLEQIDKEIYELSLNEMFYFEKVIYYALNANDEKSININNIRIWFENYHNKYDNVSIMLYRLFKVMKKYFAFSEKVNNGEMFLKALYNVSKETQKVEAI